MKFQDIGIWITLDGEDPRVVLRLIAAEIWNAPISLRPERRGEFYDYDPSQVLTEQMADSFIILESDGTLGLHMDNEYGRTFKVGIEQTLTGFVWRRYDTYCHRHEEGWGPIQILANVHTKLSEGLTELPKEQPKPDEQAGVLVLFRSANYNEVVGVSRPLGHGTFDILPYRNLTEARKNETFRIAPVVMVKDRGELSTQTGELGMTSIEGSRVERYLHFLR